MQVMTGTPHGKQNIGYESFHFKEDLKVIINDFSCLGFGGSKRKFIHSLNKLFHCLNPPFSLPVTLREKISVSAFKTYLIVASVFKTLFAVPIGSHEIPLTLDPILVLFTYFDKLSRV